MVMKITHIKSKDSMYYLAPTSKTSHHINKFRKRAMLHLVLECVYVATHTNKKHSVAVRRF